MLTTRRALMGLTVAFALALPAATPAFAAGNVAESYVSDNIHKGLEILNNKSLPRAQKEQQFEVFLLGLTDMKRIAMFTLGQYRRGASQERADTWPRRSEPNSPVTAARTSRTAPPASSSIPVARTGLAGKGPRRAVIVPSAHMPAAPTTMSTPTTGMRPEVPPRLDSRATPARPSSRPTSWASA